MKKFKKTEFKIDETETLKIKIKKNEEILKSITNLLKKRKDLVTKLSKLPNERNS